MSQKKIIIRNKKKAAIQRFHPWVFSGAVKQKAPNLEDGEIVTLLDEQEHFLAAGHYQNGSITVRVLSFDSDLIDQAFWNDKIAQAFQYRQQLGLIGNDQTNCYRLVHAEGDGLPGLIIDIYHQTAVVQCHSIGMYRSRQQIVNGLIHVFGTKLEAIYNKSGNTLPGLFASEAEADGYWLGENKGYVVLENGHRFHANWEDGQKTGFFLDQRINRQLIAADYCRGKKVLNGFCYTGGFSVYALQAGASHVDSVDISGGAIALAEQNVALNQLDAGKHHSHRADVLQFLSESREYDVVIIDPPAFAKSLKKRHNAVQGYKRLNAKAMKRVKPGGFLATFSCSQVIDQPLFQHTIVAAAHEAKRQIRIVRQLQQGPDHPVNIYHPEGAYLKGLLLYVS